MMKIIPKGNLLIGQLVTVDGFTTIAALLLTQSNCELSLAFYVKHPANNVDGTSGCTHIHILTMCEYTPPNLK